MSTIDKPRMVAETRASSYERVSAALTAFVTILGILIVLGVLIWMLTIFRIRRTEAVAIQELPGDPGLEAPLGEAEDFEEPGVEEFPEVEVPQLADALEAVTDAVSTVQARLEKVDGSHKKMGKGKGLGHREGGGGGGTGGRPWDRWSVEYTSKDINAYAQQLTFFGVEVGVVSRNTQRVDIVNNLSTRPASRASTRRVEKRVFFVHSNRRLKRWDQELARRAGVNDMSGRFLVQFYPRNLTIRLARIENEFASSKGIDLKKVTRTLFKVRPNGNGYEYFVASMN